VRRPVAGASRALKLVPVVPEVGGR